MPAIGALDVAMNIQAIIVERTSGRSMMSGFHGQVQSRRHRGSAAVIALLGAGSTPLAATLCASAITIVLLTTAARHLLPYGARREGPAFAMPHGIVVFIGVLCCIAFLTEGAVLDWSAVFLTSARELAASYAGLGYAVFAMTMTVGRFTGDRIVQRFGGSNTIICGGLCAALGFALTALAPSWQGALPGYALIGFGCSNIVPVLFTSVGRQTVMPEHVAVPAMTTLGYAGVLAGPALIGFVAHAASLSTAFLLLALMLLASPPAPARCTLSLREAQRRSNPPHQYALIVLRH